MRIAAKPVQGKEAPGPMRIFLSTGEPSGDLHAANLIRALRRRLPEAEFVGYGGPRMAEAGGRLLLPAGATWRSCGSSRCS